MISSQVCVMESMIGLAPQSFAAETAEGSNRKHKHTYVRSAIAAPPPAACTQGRAGAEKDFKAVFLLSVQILLLSHQVLQSSRCNDSRAS